MPPVQKSNIKITIDRKIENNDIRTKIHSLYKNI